MHTITTITGSKDYNTTTKLILPNAVTNELNAYHAWKNPALSEHTLSYIRDVYTQGYGFKIIAHSVPNMSYTKVRNIFSKHMPEIMRRGYNIVTPITRTLRAERVKNSADNAFRGDRMHRTSKGISGRYNGHWCRSTWEYIYAKWLTNRNIPFSMEETRFDLSNGQTYRPDFFIYEDADKLKLIAIVEIKGRFYSNNSHKPYILKSDIGSIVNVSIVSDISPYCDGSYGKELKAWKELNKKDVQH
jgi:hypothetical protein